MELKFNTNTFLSRLTQVASVVNPSSMLPALLDVQFIVSQKNNMVYMQASDNAIWLSMKAELLECDGIGGFCIDANDLVRALRNRKSEETITMALDDQAHVATFKYANGGFKLPFRDDDAFPRPSSVIEDGKERVLPAKQVLTAIESVGFAVANDELRPVMNGVHFDFFKDKMVTASSDGHKLARYCDKSITQESDEVIGFTLPKKPATLAMNILGNVDGDVKISFDERNVVITHETFKLQARLIDMKYPNYESVIPKQSPIKVRVNRNEMIEALTRVLPMGNKTMECIKLVLGDSIINVNAEDYDLSKSAVEHVLCQTEGLESSLTFGFKGSAFIECLRNVVDVDVVFELTEPTRAALIYGSTTSKDEYLSLLMPMLINA